MSAVTQSLWDLLIVVDRSGSMNMDMNGQAATIYNRWNERVDNPNFNAAEVRHKLVTSVLNGETGFISRFLSLNSKNKVAVTTFEGKAYEDKDAEGNDYTWDEASNHPTPDAYGSGYRYNEMDCETLMDWTGTANYNPNTKTIDATGKQWNGTNYMAGLVLADSMLEKVKNDGNKKMLLFISDGVPTYYLKDDNNNGQYSRYGDKGLAEEQKVVDKCREETIKYFSEEFVKEHPEVIVHTVGVSSEINGASFNSNPLTLKYMADEGGGGFIPVTKASDMNKIRELIFPKNTQITDKLSSYVQYYKAEPDIKVTRTSADGKTTQTLYEEGRITTDGNGILDSVLYTPSADEDSTGTVTAKFKEDFIMNQGWIYTLSFNVKATDKAYESYAKGDSVTSGDTGTDYGQNATSSGKSGLDSNKEATVKYTINDIKYTEDYPKPVIQVDKCKLTLTKKDEIGNSLMGVKFALKRGSDIVGTYTTDENGEVEIPSSDLLKGDYTLEETIPPDGYIQTKETVSFKVENGMITDTQTYNDWSWDVVATKNANASANEYPKNNTYPYALSLINRSKPQQVILQKIDENSAPLNEATFSLYRDCTSTADGAKSFRITVGNKEETVWGVPVDGKQNMTSENETINGTSLGGVICNEKLSGGKYYLLETTAPDGYHKLEEPVVITVGKGGVSASYCGQSADVADDGENPATYTVKISNVRGYILPNTGGIGTVWYMLGGILIMTAALLCYINTRRRKEANRL